MKTSQLTRTLILTGSLASAVIGQYFFARKPDYPWDAVVFYSVAVALFLVALRPAMLPPPARANTAHRFYGLVLWRAALVDLGLVLGLIVALQLTEPRTDHWPFFWAWLIASALYLMGFLPLPGRRQLDPEKETARVGQEQAAAAAAGELGGSSRPEGADATPARSEFSWQRIALTRGWEWLGVAALVSGAWLVRAWHVTRIPWTLSGDEGSQGLWARRVLAGQIPNIFGLGWLSVPNLSFVWQGAWFMLLGDNMLGLRLPWTVVGALTVLGAYLLVRRLFDRWLALLVAFLLATYHFHIHYSRLGSNQVADPLFVVWCLYFLVIGQESDFAGGRGSRRWAWVVSGMIAGLSFYAYAGARQVPVILLLLIIWAALLPGGEVSARQGRTSYWREYAVDFLAMCGGFVIVFGPMAIQAWQFPDNFNARLNQVGIIQSGWLDRAVEATGRTRLSLLAEQVSKAFLAFNFYRDRVVWYGPNIPLMDFASSIFLVLGAAFSVSRLSPRMDLRTASTSSRNPGAGAGWRYAVFVVWFLVTVVFGGALTENPPSSQRLVSSAIPAVFFVAVALVALAGALGDQFGWSFRDRRVLSGGLAMALAVVSLRFYFGPYQASWVYGNANAEVATRVGYYLRDLAQDQPAGQQVPLVAYFIGAPRMYADFGSLPFIAKGVQLRDVTEPLTRPPHLADPGAPSVFIVLPERAEELHWIQQAYPNGSAQEVHRINDPHGLLLFTAYKTQ